MENLTEVKQTKLKKMSSDRIKKHLVKVGYDEDELEQMSRSKLMNTLANEWLKEIKVENISSSSEEEGAVGGAKAEVKVTSPMSMEMFLQWMMMEKQERKEKEEKKEEERREKEEEGRREKEEKTREKKSWNFVYQNWKFNKLSLSNS